MSEAITITVDPDALGVLTKHHVKMQTDQTYRTRALTPPGGIAPGTGSKPLDTASGDLPLLPGILGGTISH